VPAQADATTGAQWESITQEATQAGPINMTHPAKRTVDYYQKLLTAVFEFMLIGGMRSPEILKEAVGALRNAETENSLLSPSKNVDLAFAGMILDAWHRNRRYIDRAAQPKGIPLRGKAPSVEALIRAERVAHDPVALVQRLRSLKLIIRCGRGRYKPASRFAVVAEPNSLVQQHAVRSLSTLLKTIKENLAEPQASRALIERTAEVPDLPVECVTEFRKFARSQGWALLSTLNDWLESRRARGKGRHGRETVGAGVHVFAYLGNPTRRRSKHKEMSA
jgi:hypothetical protein